MPKSFALLVDEIEQELQDSSNALWTAAELGIQLEDALREISELSPYVVREIYEFESRFGTASSTTSGALVDATKAQFRSTDVNKVIFNSTDRTWAIVTAFVSASQLTLSNNIMVSGENYQMFNRDCWSNRQLYIGNVEDYVGEDHGVVAVEYKTMKNPRQLRNFTIERTVLTVGIDFNPPESDDANADVEVFVWFNRRHQVSQLTDLAGAVDLVAGYAAGLSTIHVDGLAATEVIAEDQEFTIAGLRGVYRTTEPTTLAGNEGDITFFPPLESAIANDDVVTFLGSSLSRSQERIAVELTASRAAESKAARLLREANSAITSVASAATALGLVAAKVLRQVTDIASGRTAANLIDETVVSALTAANLMDEEAAQAIATLDTARALINTVTVGGPNVPGQYASQAATEIETARGYFDNLRAHLAAGQADAENARVWAEVGRAELEGAQGSVNEAIGYLQKAATELNTVDRVGIFRAWGREKADRALRDLRREKRPRQSLQFSRL